MKVELDVFSGRPNPTWTLPPETTADLAARLRDLPPAAAPAEEPVLGYRGFIILNPGRTVGLPARLRVHAGLVIVEEDGTPVVFRDVHGIEAELLRQARQQGHATLVDSLGLGRR